MTDDVQLPRIICGPLLRRLTLDELVLWWVSPAPFAGTFTWFTPGEKVSYTLTHPIGESLEDALPHLVYPGESRPSFMVKDRVDTLFHGSCRNPHHNSPDSFLGADRIVGSHLDAEDRPCLLMLTGDLMIFDDHDITDHWNMTAQWEAAAQDHPFSRQIIANGMAAYWLCQGWGNASDAFDPDFVEAAGADSGAGTG